MRQARTHAFCAMVLFRKGNLGRRLSGRFTTCNFSPPAHVRNCTEEARNPELCLVGVGVVGVSVTPQSYVLG